MGERTSRGGEAFAEWPKRKRMVTSPQDVVRGRTRWAKSLSLPRLTAKRADATIKEEKRQEEKGQIER